MPPALFLLAGFLGIFLYNFYFPAPSPLTETEINASVQQALASATPPPPHSAEVYQVILPSLVFIQTEREDAEGDDRFGLGSGVVVNEDGDILTSLHVVVGADRIKVYFADGSEAEGGDHRGGTRK